MEANSQEIYECVCTVSKISQAKCLGHLVPACSFKIAADDLNIFRFFIMSSQRSRVIQLYKNLLHLGKDYPQGYQYFRGKCHGAFIRNKDIEGDQVKTK